VSYDASAITVLEGLDAVRKRPGMYIGSTGERGLHHLVYEVVDNSVDEALAGYATDIQVTIQADGGVRVTDDGRGIPVDEHPVEKKPAVEVVLTVLHAGGKFGGAGYSVSGGLHGVGISVVNALSTDLHVEIHLGGFVYRQSYKHGVPVAPLEKGEKTDRTGTTVTFYADPNIFETTEFDFTTLARRFQEMAFLNRGLKLELTDERATAVEVVETEDSVEEKEVLRHVSYKYDGGISDFVKHINASKGIANPTVIDLSTENEDKTLSAEIAMQWNNTYAESVYTFANTINTTEGGTHEEGFRTALTSLVNKFSREWNILKEKDTNLSGEDIREGLTAIVSVKLSEPQFEGQTKTKLGNTEMKAFVQKVVNDQLGAWFEQNPAEGKEIARKAEECEVFIVEGDSAGGSARQGRDPRTQAILPIRGKILNVEKARIDKVLQNTEVQALISAFGTGVQEEFDINRLRYHKVVLMADADVDGQHIRTLLLTLLFRFMRPLVEQGYVYLAQPPLYKIKWSREVADFAYTEREKDALIEAGLAAGRRLPKEEALQRYKGLGEMNADELWETTMNPADRVLLQVTLDDAAQADEMFSVLMGEDVESRRNFIQQNARDVRFLDI
jgi:DNA gyrase subunit B